MPEAREPEPDEHVFAVIQATMEHPVRRRTASWSYVFGSAALVIFGLQLVTGILLAFQNVPSAGEAWSGLQVVNHQGLTRFNQDRGAGFQNRKRLRLRGPARSPGGPQ